VNKSETVQQAIERVREYLSNILSASVLWMAMEHIDTIEWHIKAQERAIAVRDRAMRELLEELRSCKGAIRNYVAREGGLL
jgi:hypothetical protein